MSINFEERLRSFQKEHQTLVDRKNVKLDSENGIFDRYQYPVLTAKHIPLSWRFDFNPTTNPLLLERIGFNAVFNAGAIKFHDKYVLAARVEGNDRKSFFAIAESDNGIDNFRFHEFPIRMPQTEIPDTNIYDMRLVRHEDGWIYGIFCTERRDPDVPDANQSAAIAQCGIARTKNLVDWMRLPDIKTDSPQQRNVVLHPEFVQGKYAFYTRPQDGFIEAGSGGGIGFGLCDDIEHAVITCEVVMDKKEYHTIYEAKNGLGPAPIKTPKGWLHLAHGVRNTAAGLRYTLYMFMTDLHDLTKIIHKPAGYFMAPEGNEFIGDVPNVLFSNGWIADENGAVFIYYASSDTRMHVATSTIEKLMDYVINSPEDEFRTDASVGKVIHLVEENIKTKIYKKYVHDEKHVHF